MNQAEKWTKQFSAMAKRVKPPEISWLMRQALETPGMISLAAGFVDQESLPNTAVSPILSEMLAEAQSGQFSLQYGTTQGDPVLREHLIERLKKENVFHPHADIDASHVIVGSGSQQLLYLVSETMLDEGDIVLVEAPTYFVVLGAFAARGARTIGIDTDENGLNPEHLNEVLRSLDETGELKRVKMLYLMTYSANPTGLTLAESRRGEVLDTLRFYRGKGFPILLLEDGAYRRLNFSESPPMPIKSQEEENDLILYTESFSKSLAPGLRLGFGVGPKPIIDKMVDLKGNHDFGSSNFCQQILKRMLSMDTFDLHTQELRKVYKEKCELMLSILRETFPPEAQWIAPDGGFLAWVSLPNDWDTGPDGDIFKEAINQKVLYVPGSLCFSSDREEAQQCSSLRLSFGMIKREALQTGCERLGAAISRVAAMAGG